MLFTDVEGSTKLLHELGAAGTPMPWRSIAASCVRRSPRTAAAGRHDELLDDGEAEELGRHQGTHNRADFPDLDPALRVNFYVDARMDPWSEPVPGVPAELRKWTERPVELGAERLLE